MIDSQHTVPGATLPVRFVKAGDEDGFEVDLSEIPLPEDCVELTVMVYPDDAIREVNEGNNAVQRTICPTP